jgi:predicted DNA binding CopG/RHH family protein
MRQLDNKTNSIQQKTTDSKTTDNKKNRDRQQDLQDIKSTNVKQRVFNFDNKTMRQQASITIRQQD